MATAIEVDDTCDEDMEVVERVVEKACEIASRAKDLPIEVVVQRTGGGGGTYTIKLLGFTNKLNVEDFLELKKDRTVGPWVDTIVCDMWAKGVIDENLTGGLEITLSAPLGVRFADMKNGSSRSARTPFTSPDRSVIGKKRPRSKRSPSPPAKSKYGRVDDDADVSDELEEENTENKGILPKAYEFLKSAGCYLLDVVVPVWEEKENAPSKRQQMRNNSVNYSDRYYNSDN